MSLQSKRRATVARRLFNELKKEQKDVGKLKGMNTKLKEEMASLRAMLAAQAKEGAASAEHEKALAEKQAKLDNLEARIADLEKQLAEAKQKVSQLEASLAQQKSISAKDKEQINQLTKQLRTVEAKGSTGGFVEQPIMRRSLSKDSQEHQRSGSSSSIPAGIPADYVSPEVLAEHRVKVALLEDELASERRLRREADGEIIKLRAAANGVKLDSDMVSDLLSPDATRSEESSFADSEVSPSKPRYVMLCLFLTHSYFCLIGLPCQVHFSFVCSVFVGHGLCSIACLSSYIHKEPFALCHGHKRVLRKKQCNCKCVGRVVW